MVTAVLLKPVTRSYEPDPVTLFPQLGALAVKVRPVMPGPP
jgi:hypothetical protein